MSATNKTKAITAKSILKMKKDGIKIPVLTAYSYPIAKIIDQAGIPVILVGDSLAMVEAGMDSTLPVTMDEMIYHTKSVRRGTKNALLVADMPFMSYQTSIATALKNAGRFLKEAQVGAVKLEGGLAIEGTIKAIVTAGIPVMGHIGLTPQSVNTLGGYKVQGKNSSDAEKIIEDALAVERAGAFSVVLECVPSKLAKVITERLSIPTIGIGAGLDCDGQVLVINDVIGLNGGLDSVSKPPKFVKQYANVSNIIETSVKKFSNEVTKGKFPTKEHSY